METNRVMTKPKWTYEDFYKAIVQLQGQVRQIETKLATTEIAILQHRKALSDASFAMEKALTECPVEWTNRDAEGWESFFSEQERVRLEKFKATRKPNPLNNVNGLPH